MCRGRSHTFYPIAFCKPPCSKAPLFQSPLFGGKYSRVGFLGRLSGRRSRWARVRFGPIRQTINPQRIPNSLDSRVLNGLNLDYI